MEVLWMPFADLLDGVLAGRIADAPLVNAVLLARARGLVGDRAARVGQVKVGIPKEVKDHEYRVAITPIGVHELVAHGHEVVIQTEAGVGSGIPDDEFVAAGAKILPDADAVWGEAEMVLKVKEPVAEEYGRMREGQTLFTYLHLAADKPLTEELINRKVTGIAYETVQLTSSGGCRCSTRCRRWPAAWRRRSARTRC